MRRRAPSDQARRFGFALRLQIAAAVGSFEQGEAPSGAKAKTETEEGMRSSQDAQEAERFAHSCSFSRTLWEHQGTAPRAKLPQKARDSWDWQAVQPLETSCL